VDHTNFFLKGLLKLIQVFGINTEGGEIILNRLGQTLLFELGMKTSSGTIGDMESLFSLGIIRTSVHDKTN
jgi:hypothetical protein